MTHVAKSTVNNLGPAAFSSTISQCIHATHFENNNIKIAKCIMQITMMTRKTDAGSSTRGDMAGTKGIWLW